MNISIRKLGYGFLFAFHSNYCSILKHFRDKAKSCTNIAIIFHTPIRRPLQGNMSQGPIVTHAYTRAPHRRSKCENPHVEGLVPIITCKTP